MSASRTLLRKMNRRGRRVGLARRRGEPFRRVLKEETVGRVLLSYHATKGVRQRAIPERVHADAYANGGLEGVAKLWANTVSFARGGLFGPLFTTKVPGA